ncbi:MAG TPA: hypothetical protein DCX07_06505, partial [Phycisphaerales bacterium]|nr:hypothetical protein [Phycisphaerales bacterium]
IIALGRYRRCGRFRALRFFRRDGLDGFLARFHSRRLVGRRFSYAFFFGIGRHGYGGRFVVAAV